MCLWRRPTDIHVYVCVANMFKAFLVLTPTGHNNNDDTFTNDVAFNKNKTSVFGQFSTHTTQQSYCRVFAIQCD